MESNLSGWGRLPVMAAEEETPSESGQLPGLLVQPYLPRGQGRSYGDASLPAHGHRSINTAGISRMLSFNPSSGVMDAESGVTLAAILAVTLPRGFFLPVTPGTTCISLGGALASNVHGKNHHRSGSIEHFVLEMEVSTPIGHLICSRQKNPDLFFATLGGYGLTGFITRAKIKMKPIAGSDMEVLRVRAPNLDALFALLKKYEGDFEYSVAWLDTLARGSRLGRGVLMLGNHVDPKPGQAPFQSAALSRGKLRVPFALPGLVLNRPFLSAFNCLYYRMAPQQGRKVREGFAGFFYPLDKIQDWNLLYGKSGFFQYQCVIPDPQGEAGMADCLRFLSDNRLGAFLSVLKRCGEDEVLLPFCRRGYTLALDIPFRGPETLRLLDRLDALVIGYGGRVYLSKDARLSPAAFRAMYPENAAWMAVVRKYNPQAHSNSRLAQRLELWQA